MPSETNPPSEPLTSSPPSRRDALRGRLHDGWRRLEAKGWLKWVPAGAVAALLLVYTGWYTCGFTGCPDPESLLAYEPGGAPIILDRNGERFATLLPVQREIMDIDSLPPHVGQAFIAVEDRRFLRHGGVDLFRMGGALMANIRKGGVAEGGSTITMQLARNAFPDRLPAAQRTMKRKIVETRVALAIEDEFDKDQIMGLYLNQIYFGNGATGIAAASRQYFGIPPTELRPEQAAVLAALVKAPAYYDPREDQEEALERRNLVLDLMLDAGFLTEQEHEAARAAEMEVVPRKRGVDAGESLPAPWFLEAIRRRLERELGSDMYRTQVQVHSTLDAKLQAAAEEALYAQLRRVEGGQFGTYRGAAYDPAVPPDSAGATFLQGAVVVLDAETGDVLALVGGRNYRLSSFDHVFDAQRQIGSAFKPFVYGAAVKEGLGPSHRLDDAPLAIDMRGSPTYRPTNYDGGFEGAMTAREALRRSRNVPTVRLAQEVGTGKVAAFAKEAGMDADIPEGPSMALGTVALSPMALARVYSSFAGLGRGVESRVLTRVETTDGKLLWEAEVSAEDRIEPRVAYVVNDMLKGVVDGGTGGAVRSAGFRGTAAGKTGTTQDAADAWFVGYTPELVGVVWIGFDQPAPILANASGGALAAPVWGRMMVQGGRSGADWPEPDGVVRLAFDPSTGNPLSGGCTLASRAPRELFLRGKEGPSSCPSYLTVGDEVIMDDRVRDSLRMLDSFYVGPGDSMTPGMDTFPRIEPGRLPDSAGYPPRPDSARRPPPDPRRGPPVDTLRPPRGPDTLRPPPGRDTLRRRPTPRPALPPDTVRPPPPDTVG